MEFQIELLDKPCGILRIELDRFSFSYQQNYLSAQGPPVSVSMPLRKEPYGDQYAFPFFENLLPEGQIRRLIAEKLQTSENNFQSLFKHLGEDVAGALRILAPVPQQASSGKEKAAPRKLTARELGEILKKIEVAPFLAGEKQELRLSLAGAQNKMPVIVRDGAVYLSNGQPSTHIIKPPSSRFPFLVENEYLCMRGAHGAGLDVPRVDLLSFENEQGEQHDCLVITRYDRESIDQHIARIHQEDLCQISSIPSSQKYTRDGGPGYAELFDAVRRYTRPSAIHQRELIKRILFNILIGNNDAHGKNFSLLHRSTASSLAPAYDLVSSQLYADLTTSFAMPFGSADSNQELDCTSLANFEQVTGISMLRQRTQLGQFVEDAHDAMLREIDNFEKEVYPDSQRFLKPFRKLISGNKAGLLRMLRV